MKQNKDFVSEQGVGAFRSLLNSLLANVRFNVLFKDICQQKALFMGSSESLSGHTD